MARIEAIFQGVTPRTHLEAIKSLIKVKDIEKIIISVAFLREAGIEQLEDLLKKTRAEINIFAGVRNGITTVQGMRRAFALTPKNLYAVDTGSTSEIFHPKIFLAQGNGQARAIIGSANLTLGGLNNNIEFGAVARLNLLDEGDEAFVSGILDALSDAVEEYPENFIKIGSDNDLADMFDSGRLADEDVKVLPRQGAVSLKNIYGENIPRIKLKVPKIYRFSKSIGMNDLKKEENKEGVDISKITNGYRLIWETSNLKRRDLNIPAQREHNEPGKRTNVTGSINLDQGEMDEEVDFQRYFRWDAFKALPWPADSADVDEVEAEFEVVIKGISYGRHWLTIAHTTSTTSPTFDQGNAMTRLRWGAAKRYVAREDLLGRSLRLYRDNETETKFILEIN